MTHCWSLILRTYSWDNSCDSHCWSLILRTYSFWWDPHCWISVLSWSLWDWHYSLNNFLLMNVWQFPMLGEATLLCLDTESGMAPGIPVSYQPLMGAGGGVLLVSDSQLVLWCDVTGIVTRPGIWLGCCNLYLACYIYCSSEMRGVMKYSASILLWHNVI